MPHPLIKQTVLIADALKDKIGLSESQVKEIYDLELNYYRDNMFNYDPYYTEEQGQKLLIQEIEQVCNSTQLEKFIQIRQRKVEKEAVVGFKSRIEGKLHIAPFEELNIPESKVDAFARLVEKIDLELPMAMSRSARELKPFDELQFQIFFSGFESQIKNIIGKGLFPRFEELYRYKKDLRHKVLESHIRYKFGIPDLSEFEVKKIAEFEELMRREYLFFPWHELHNMEIEFMRECLDEVNYKQYLVYADNKLESRVKEHQSRNKRLSNDIIRNKNQYHFFRGEILPVITNKRIHIEAILNDTEKKMIDLWRMESLQVFKSGIIQCFNSISDEEKLYVPNQWIKQKWNYMTSACYQYFGFLKERKQEIVGLRENVKRLILEQSDEEKDMKVKFKEFKMRNYESTGGTYGAGMMVIRQGPNEEEMNLSNIFTFLLQYPDLKMNLNRLKEIQTFMDALDQN